MASFDDGRSPEPGDLAARIAEILITEEIEQIDAPHIVACTDPATGAVIFTGPYADGISALVAAAHNHELELRSDPSSRFTFSVAPCHRPPAAR